MIFYKFYKSHQKSKVPVFDFVAWNFTSFTSPIQSPKVPVYPVFDFCIMNALTSYKPHPKSQMPVFDFVAWVCLQVSQVSPRLFPLTISHHYRIKIWWIQRNMVLWKWYYYRIKNLNSTIFYIWFLFTKSKAHTCWAKRVSDGFRGTILYRIKFIPSYYLKTTTESRSEDMTLRGMLYWKIKDLRVSQAWSLQKSVACPKSKVFVHSRLTVGAPVYRIMDLLIYSPNMSKIDDFWGLTSPWPLIL